MQDQWVGQTRWTHSQNRRQEPCLKALDTRKDKQRGVWGDSGYYRDWQLSVNTNQPAGQDCSTNPVVTLLENIRCGAVSFPPPGETYKKADKNRTTVGGGGFLTSATHFTNKETGFKRTTNWGCKTSGWGNTQELTQKSFIHKESFRHKKLIHTQTQEGFRLTAAVPPPPRSSRISVDRNIKKKTVLVV